ncbi:MAG: hypothetical protein KDJ98_06070 [Rhodobacteraceae bacterium]|nr:hypothetical protein [Paracoccaceae bacterium]
MTRLLSLALAAGLMAGQASADGAVPVPLPTIPAMSVGAGEHLLMQLVVANLVSENCPAYQATDAEWSLLAGSADLVAERLGLGVDDYDNRFYRRAFGMLDKPDTCDREGPRIRPLINRLIAWGGSLEPLN